MGGVIGKAPISTRFLLGFTAGSGIAFGLPSSIFDEIRDKSIPTIQAVTVEVDPKVHQTKAKVHEKNLRILRESKNFPEKDQNFAYTELKNSYRERMVDMADDEELWVEQQMKSKEENPIVLHEINIEYEAVKRIEQKKKAQNQ